jgi:vacuolar-type H+-ATPase subunit F/Vma7
MPEETHLDKPLGVIGDEDAVAVFKALGFKVYPVRNLTSDGKIIISNGVNTAKEPQEFSAILDKAVSEKVAICLVQDNLYQALESQINSYRHLALPIFIPFAKDAKMALLDNLVKNIRLRATGTF